MKKFIEYVDECQNKLDLNDAALSKKLGGDENRTLVSSWRNRGSAPDDYYCILIAEILDIDPLEIIAAANYTRAKDDEKKTWWENFRKQCAKNTVGVLLCIGLLAGFGAVPGSHEAGMAAAIFVCWRLRIMYIMSSSGVCSHSGIISTMSKKNEVRLNSALELLFYGYRAFTALPDEILAERKLARVHHRILYFVARDPGSSVNKLLSKLCVSKQALNAPLRQLQERGLVVSIASEQDRRVKCLTLTEEGAALEAHLSASQHELLSSIFDLCGQEAETGWRMVMSALAHHKNSPDH